MCDDNYIPLLARRPNSFLGGGVRYVLLPLRVYHPASPTPISEPSPSFSSMGMGLGFHPAPGSVEKLVTQEVPTYIEKIVHVPVERVVTVERIVEVPVERVVPPSLPVLFRGTEHGSSWSLSL